MKIKYILVIFKFAKFEWGRMKLGEIFDCYTWRFDQEEWKRIIEITSIMAYY